MALLCQSSNHRLNIHSSWQIVWQCWSQRLHTGKDIWNHSSSNKRYGGHWIFAAFTTNTSTLGRSPASMSAVTASSSMLLVCLLVSLEWGQGINLCGRGGICMHCCVLLPHLLLASPFVASLPAVVVVAAHCCWLAVGGTRWPVSHWPQLLQLFVPKDWQSGSWKCQRWSWSCCCWRLCCKLPRDVPYKCNIYRTMVLLARPTKVRRYMCDRVKIHRFTIWSSRFTDLIFHSTIRNRIIKDIAG